MVCKTSRRERSRNFCSPRRYAAQTSTSIGSRVNRAKIFEFFLLDTNVLSEPTRPRPEARVLEWLEAVDEDRLFISVVSIAEIRRGVALLSRGRRRDRLGEWLSRDLPDRFDGPSSGGRSRRGRAMGRRHGCVPSLGRHASSPSTRSSPRRRWRMISRCRLATCGIFRPAGCDCSTLGRSAKLENRKRPAIARRAARRG